MRTGSCIACLRLSNATLCQNSYEETTAGGARGSRRAKDMRGLWCMVGHSMTACCRTGRSESRQQRTPRALESPTSRFLGSPDEKTKPSSGEFNARFDRWVNGPWLAGEKRKNSPGRSGEKTVWAIPPVEIALSEMSGRWVWKRGTVAIQMTVHAKINGRAERSV